MTRLADQLEAYLLQHREALVAFLRSKVGDDDLAEDILHHTARSGYSFLRRTGERARPLDRNEL